ncbi:MAG: O-antigen ligase family protein [Syntrophobacteraceae bacterium]
MQYTTAGLSYLPVDTFFSGLWYIVLALLAVCLQKLIKKGAPHKNGLFTVLFAVVGAEAVYGLLQIFIPSIATPSGDASGTFINRNHFASFLGMIWPLQLAWLLTLSGESRKKSDRGEDEIFRLQNTMEKQIFFAFLTALTLLALLFSRSRGGILSALVGAILLVFLGKGGFRRVLPFLACCWLTAFAYGWLIGLQGILDRFASAGVGALGRFQIYQFAWNMIKDHWLAGTGLATFGHVACVYQVFDTDLVQVGNAHGDYLQMAVECGLPFGLFIAVLIWGYWLSTAYELFKSPGKESQEPESADARLIRTGALAGSAAFLCHIWVESSWQIPANQVCFVILLVLMRFRPAIYAAERMKPGILPS